MVTVNTIHFLFIGIYFLIVGQLSTFQESILSFMLILGIFLVIIAIIGRILKAIGMKIKKELGKEQIQVSKNYYLTYFLIAIAVISTLYGLMTMPNSI